MQKTIYGYERPIIEMGLVRGRNMLIANGATQCENPMYYKDGADYWHYNKLSKCWYKD